MAKDITTLHIYEDILANKVYSLCGAAQDHHNILIVHHVVHLVLTTDPDLTLCPTCALLQIASESSQS
jgi:hypothetical protein